MVEFVCIWLWWFKAQYSPSLHMQDVVTVWLARVFWYSTLFHVCHNLGSAAWFCCMLKRIASSVTFSFKPYIRLFSLCFPSRSVITNKYNTVDNTTLYLYTKIVYFVRVTCLNHKVILRPSKKHIQELFTFHCIVGSHKHKQSLDLLYWSMFHPQALQEADPRVVVCFIALWDPTNINNSWICFLEGLRMTL